MDTETESFRNQTKVINNNVSILSSQKDFEEHMGKINDSIENPTTINEEINYQKESFSKLKFQYLEQETKEKFLRSLFDNPPLSVDQGDINNLQEENTHSKQFLKGLKESMDIKMKDIHELSREVIQLNEEFEYKNNETNKILDEFQRIETKLNLVIDNQQDDTKEIIKSLIEISRDMNDKDLTKIMTNSDDKLVEIENRKAQSNKDFHLKTQLNENQQQHIQKLHEKLYLLRTNLQNVDRDEKPSDNQFFAQWVKEMNEIMINLNGLSQIQFQFDNRDDLKLVVNDYNIILNKKFHILNDNALKRFNEIVLKINSNDNKMENFLVLINLMLDER